RSQNNLDLSSYAGRWVALVRGRVAGVGHSADEARRAAHTARPKEKAALRFVFVEGWQDFYLLRRLWVFIEQRGARALLVGGAVRDGLLGRPLHDLDFVVDGDATALAAAARRAFRGALVPLDRERDTARVVIRHKGRRFDLDFARCQGHDWEADLHARDFTVNAIAVDPTGRYLDPLNGRDDLAAGRLRATNENAFRDDPLRTLRAVRLMAELGLCIEPQTVAWVRRDAPLLPHIAAERVRDEFTRILDAPGAARHLGTLDDLGLLAQVLPEVTALQDVSQSPPHRWDVWTHTRMTVDALGELLAYLGGASRGDSQVGAPGWVWGDVEKRLGPLQADIVAHLGRVVSDTRERSFVLKLAALLHDVGKPQTRSLGDDGRIHFYQHEQVGANLAAERLRALRFSGDEIALAQTMIAHHLRPGQLARDKGLSRRAIYRFFKATGEVGVEIGLLSLSDMLAVWGAALPSRRWLRRLDVVTTLLSAFFDRSPAVLPPPLINGRELMGALELAPGPEVGRLLEAIREAQASGEVETRQQALALAARLRRERENYVGS
ncbi:MAG: HD domain-containing protein, partial [Anaerolineae bacterium]